MIESLIPNGACPVCLVRLDMATGTPGTEDAADPGSFCVCIYCTTVLVLAEDMSLRRVTEQELRALTQQQRDYLRKVQEAARKAMQKMRAKSRAERPLAPNERQQ